MTKFKIGDFAKLTQVSTHRLRNYDKHGLLIPDHIDKFTGYRYYSAEQMGKLNRIIALLGLGLSLEEVKAALASNICPKQMEEMLFQRRLQLEKELELKSNQLNQVQNRLKLIKEESGLPNFEVVIKAIPAYPIASIRMLIKNRGDVSYYCNNLHPEIHQSLAEFDITPSLPTINLYHNDTYPETDIDLEACAVVSPDVIEQNINSRVQFRWLPAAPQAATFLFTEDYSELERSFIAIMNWGRREGYSLCGAIREIHHSPMVNSIKRKAGQPVVEFQFPIEKISS